MGDVIQFPGPSGAPIPPAKILREAAEQTFEDVVVLGFTTDGDLYAASSTADGGTVFWLMERVKLLIHEWADEMERV